MSNTEKLILAKLEEKPRSLQDLVREIAHHEIPLTVLGMVETRVVFFRNGELHRSR